MQSTLELAPPRTRSTLGIDLAIAAPLLGLMIAMEPRLINGDGLGYLSSILTPSTRTLEARHILFVPLAKGLLGGLTAIGLRSQLVRVLLLVMHLCAVGIYGLLARVIYPRFLSGPFWPRLCAVGTVLSYGVLSRTVDLETYAPALLSDVGLLAVLLATDLGRPRNSILAAFLFVLAVGFHVTNVILAPFVLAWYGSRARGGGWAPFVWFAASGLVFGLVVLGALHIHCTGSLWPLELGIFVPSMLPQPPMSLPARLGRAAFGIARSLLFVPYYREIRAGYLVCAGALGLLGLAAVAPPLIGGRASLPGRTPAWYAGLALLALPFVGLGLRYYPSDPERWLFLTPVLWLLLGVLWDAGGRRARAAATGLVVALGLFNIVFGLMPEAYGVYSPSFSLIPGRFGYRSWVGQQALAVTVKPGDLVITLGNIGGPANDFLGPSVPADALVLESLATRYWDDVPAFQDQIRRRVNERLDRGQRVLVYGFYGEHNVKMSPPWATLPGYTIGPETVQAVLDEYRATTLRSPTPYTLGITRLDRPGGGGADQGK